MTFEFWLHDVFRQAPILGKTYRGSLRDARRMAHRFVDEIILRLTGVRGPFDTRIAYVSTGRDRFKEIYVSHLDGTEKKKVTNNRTINLFPSWTPTARDSSFFPSRRASRSCSDSTFPPTGRRRSPPATV